jgi:hypothetical protein
MGSSKPTKAQVKAGLEILASNPSWLTEESIAAALARLRYDAANLGDPKVPWRCGNAMLADVEFIARALRIHMP